MLDTKTASHSSAHEVRRDVQGLRALAVLAVLVFHVDKEWLPSGFNGVDFVLFRERTARPRRADIYGRTPSQLNRCEELWAFRRIGFGRSIKAYCKYPSAIIGVTFIYNSVGCFLLMRYR